MNNNAKTYDIKQLYVSNFITENPFWGHKFQNKITTILLKTNVSANIPMKNKV